MSAGGFDESVYREIPDWVTPDYSDDVVFDPFTGSGTTLIVAADTKRRTVGLDIDESYCELAKNRIMGEIDTLL